MSHSLIDSVCKSSLNELTKMVMLVLAADANDEGYGVLSDINDALQRTSLSEEDLCREFAALDKAGIFSWKNQSGHPAIVYKIDADNLKAVELPQTSSNQVVMNRGMS